MTRRLYDRPPTLLPARWNRQFPWRLDKRLLLVRELAGDLTELWTSLGGFESLSPQRRWLAERVVFMRRQMLEYEVAVLAGTKPVMDSGCYSNFANVVVGHLKTLGIDRQAKNLMTLREVMAGKAPAPSPPSQRPVKETA